MAVLEVVRIAARHESGTTSYVELSRATSLVLHGSNLKPPFPAISPCPPPIMGSAGLASFGIRREPISGRRKSTSAVNDDDDGDDGGDGDDENYGGDDDDDGDHDPSPPPVS